jgi:hypothetical protein
MKVIRSLQKNAVTFLIRIQRTLLNIVNAQIPPEAFASGGIY